MEEKDMAIESYKVAPAEEMPQEEAKSPLEGFQDPIKAVLEMVPGLTRAQIDKWKATFGGVYALVLEDEVFLYRAFSRLEHKQFLNTIMESSPSKSEEEKEDLYEELVVTRCLLWPKPGGDFAPTSKGGTIPTLFSAVNYKSNFLPPQVVVSSIVTL